MCSSDLAARACHQLGIIAGEQREFAAAEGWYRRSLTTFEKLGDEHGAATTYHQLGLVASEQGDFTVAEGWYRRSLAINEKLGDEHGAAGTYHQMGSIALEQRDFAAAGDWALKALLIFVRMNSRHNARIAAGSFLRIVGAAPPDQQAALQARWEAAGLGPFPTDALGKQRRHAGKTGLPPACSPPYAEPPGRMFGRGKDRGAVGALACVVSAPKAFGAGQPRNPEGTAALPTT